MENQETKRREEIEIGIIDGIKFALSLLFAFLMANETPAAIKNQEDTFVGCKPCVMSMIVNKKHAIGCPQEMYGDEYYCRGTYQAGSDKMS